MVLSPSPSNFLNSLSRFQSEQLNTSGLSQSINPFACFGTGIFLYSIFPFLRLRLRVIRKSHSLTIRNAFYFVLNKDLPLCNRIENCVLWLKFPFTERKKLSHLKKQEKSRLILEFRGVPLSIL